MIDPQQLRQTQTRVLVLARVNADAYDPGQWWKENPTRGYRSLLHRFRVVEGGEKPGKDLASGVVRLPEKPELRVSVFYEQICPSFRELIQRRYLSNGKSVVAFSSAATPTREETANSSKGTVTLYPGSPLLEDDLSGFDLLRQLAQDMDELIRFEAADGFHTLVSLFGRYNLQFRSTGGQTNLPSGLTNPSDMQADLAIAMLDALFAPGAVYRFADEGKSLLDLAADLSLQGEYKSLTRQLKPEVKEPFLPAAILDFRHICTTPGASSLRPIDPALQRLSSGVDGPSTTNIVPNLSKFLEGFQRARRALNHASQTLQSNLLLGSIADWLLAKGISETDNPDEFQRTVQDTFTRGVAAGRSTVVGAAVRDEAKKRFIALLDKRFPGDEHEAKKRRLSQMYAMAEPYLCAMPVFRADEVAANGLTEAALLLDEALTEGDPQVRKGVEEGGKKAGKALQILLKMKGRIEYRLPGMLMPTVTLCENMPLVAHIDKDRVILRGQFSEENLKILLKEAERRGPDVANVVFRAFNRGENILPEEQFEQLDKTLEPLADDLEKADLILVERHRDLRNGFLAGTKAISGAALAIGDSDTRNIGGDIWDRTSKEAARIATSTTGLRDLQSVEQPYNRILAAPRNHESGATEVDRLEEEVISLTHKVLADVPVENEQSIAEALLASVSSCRERLIGLDSKDVRVQHMKEGLDAVDRVLNGQETEKARDSLQDTRDWLVALHADRNVSALIVPQQTSNAELTHYFDGRQRVLEHYLKKADNPTQNFASRTRFVWLSQLVLHIHRRLPMAEGRTDTGNLCGLVLELVKHLHATLVPDEEVGELLENQVRDDFFQANPGGLTRFILGQTIEDVVSLARGYHDQTDESRRTLHDLRNDLKGMEELLRSLPKGAELIVLNMTADDFAALDWDNFPELFDAFRLQQDHGPSLLPTAMLLSRSAQRWPYGSASQALNAFLAELDRKIHSQSHSGRCVVPPIFVAASVPIAPLVSSPAPADVLAFRRNATAELQSLAVSLEKLQGELSFPVFAVGVPARLKQPATYVSWSPYLLLARLCGAGLLEPLTSEGAVQMPASPLALGFIQPGGLTISQLVDGWLRDERALGANLFAWVVSVIFRSEMGGGKPLNIPISNGKRVGSISREVIRYWEHFAPVAPPLKKDELSLLDTYDHGYVGRTSDGKRRRFDGWSFAPPSGLQDAWVAITSHPVVRLDQGDTMRLDWLRRLLSKLF